MRLTGPPKTHVKWEEQLHPRDTQGRFARKFAGTYDRGTRNTRSIEDATLRTAIETFGKRKDVQLLQDPAQAWGNCDESSVAFTSYLESLGLHPQLFSMDDAMRTHVVTQVQGMFIDWSARQYYPDADVPDIFEDPWDRGFAQAYKWPKKWHDQLVKKWNPHKRIEWEDSQDEYEQVQREEPDWFEYVQQFYD